MNEYEADLNVYFSENPEDDIWLNLKKYSFVENIQRYYEGNNINPTELLTETISGSIMQAYEYFQASKTSSIHTAPLLLYYGAINLLFASSCLLTGEVVTVNGHGIKLVKSNNLTRNILQNKIKIVDPNNGGFSVYLKSLSKRTQCAPNNSEWSIAELLGSIPEIYKEFVEVVDKSKLHIIPLEEVVFDDEIVFRSNPTVLSVAEVQEKITNIPGYKENYLQAQIAKKDKVVFRKKMNGENLIKKSYFNENYFSVGHCKSKNLYDFDPYFYVFLTLYALGTICRYHPQIWTPFVRLDNTGEVNFIEKFLFTTRRYLPNYVLDKIENKKHIYSNQIYSPRNIRKDFSESELDRKIKRHISKFGGDFNGNI